MFYLILKKRKFFEYSYNFILLNSRRKFLKKLGVISYNIKLKKFIFNINFFEFCIFLKNGFYISNQFKIFLNILINHFKI